MVAALRCAPFRSATGRDKPLPLHLGSRRQGQATASTPGRPPAGTSGRYTWAATGRDKRPLWQRTIVHAALVLEAGRRSVSSEVFLGPLALTEENICSIVSGHTVLAALDGGETHERASLSR